MERASTIIALCGMAGTLELRTKPEDDSSGLDDVEVWAEMQLNGQCIGTYHESTRRTIGEVVSTIATEFALGRLGSQVRVRSYDGERYRLQEGDIRLQAHPDNSR